MIMEKSLIEEWLPIRELSRDAAIEMAYKAIPAYIKHCRELKIPEKNIKRKFYDPKIRNLHPWFARRPCSVARAITLAAVLPTTISNETFMKAIGWNRKSTVFISEGYPPLLFYTNPDQKLINEILLKFFGKEAGEIIVCDPMAGGGTIPLESLRLGFKSIAVEYNPVAYLILKATIEYPSLYGMSLAEQVRDESRRLISFVRETLGKFYPIDSEGYIIARGIKCPNCEGHIPLLHSAQISRTDYLRLKFNSSRKTFKSFISKVPRKLPYEGKKRGRIVCPYCGVTIIKKEAYRLWTSNHTAILRELKKGIFNEDKILSTHVLLIKQTKKGYQICDKRDISCFLEACKTLMNSFEELKKYMPMNEIDPSNEVFSPLREYGIKYWYELFNPRQLLVIAMLTKYVYERCKYLSSKKGELGAAISLYLALGISRVIDYNSIATTWKKGTIRDTIGRYAQGRRITYGEEYCEAIIPYRNLNWIYEPDFMQKKRTEGGICPILTELCKRLSNTNKKVRIIHGDCRFLSLILPDVVDVINVDPPYFDQHIYSDISEYFWQVLRVTLKPLIEAGFLFKETKINNWKPSSPTVPREGEIIARKGKKYTKSFNEEWYTSQMAMFFKECFKVLKKDGLLLIWFTHRSLNAWKALISALYTGGFYVTRIWPITSELLTRLVSRENDSTLNKTLIIVARKRGEEEISEEELKEYALHLMKEMTEVLAKIDGTRSELYTFLQAAAMCAVTKVPLPKDVPNPVQFCRSKLIPGLVKLAKKTFPVMYEQFNKKYLKRTLEDFWDG